MAAAIITIAARRGHSQNAAHKTEDAEDQPEIRKTFPATADIIKDLEIHLLVGRKVILFVQCCRIGLASQKSHHNIFLQF
jgi:hypothetical protein